MDNKHEEDNMDLEVEERLALKIANIVLEKTPKPAKMVFPNIKHEHIGDCPDCLEHIPKQIVKETSPHPEFKDVYKWIGNHVPKCTNCQSALARNGFFHIRKIKESKPKDMGVFNFR